MKHYFYEQILLLYKRAKSLTDLIIYLMKIKTNNIIRNYIIKIGLKKKYILLHILYAIKLI